VQPEDGFMEKAGTCRCYNFQLPSNFNYIMKFVLDCKIVYIYSETPCIYVCAYIYTHIYIQGVSLYI